MTRKKALTLIMLLCVLTRVSANLWNQLITFNGQIQLEDIVILYQYRTLGQQIANFIIKSIS